MKILFLSRWFPYPASNGSKLRIYNLLLGLSEHHDVTLLSFTDRSDMSSGMSALRKLCSEVQTVSWREYDPQSRLARVGLLSSKPRFLLDTHSVQMETGISRLISKNKYDLVIASQITMASYFPVFRGIPALFEEIELGSFYDLAFHNPDVLKRFRFRLTWFKLREYLSHLLHSFTAGTVVSEREHQIFTSNLSHHGQKIKVLPNCINLKDYEKIDAAPKPMHLIFSGSFNYRPNYYAMQWFVNKAFPLILDQIPDAELIITGEHAGLPFPQTKNVTLAGHVKDIKSLIAACDVSIAPIWSGGGTRLKIIEAMAIGTPVVATSKGAEGLLARNGEHLLIADAPQPFADHVIRILQNKDLSRYLSSNALRLVKEHYDSSTVLPRFLGLVDQAASRRI